MAYINDSQIITILQATPNIPKDIMEQIVKIKTNGKNDSKNSLLDDLASYNLLSSDCVEKFKVFLASLQENFDPEKKSAPMSPFLLPEEKKKDILFARQAINEAICTIEEINKCFAEQAETEKKKGKSQMLGQIVVKNLYIPVDRFVKINRDIEQKIQKMSIDEILVNEKRLKIAIKDNVISIVESYIPEKFGPYRILQEVARGGMGVVYKAWDAKLKRAVALKILKAWENPPLEEIQRFHREARLAASLHHPNIVSIYDAGVVDGVHYFTMDYVEGETLSQTLQKKRHDYRESLVIIREIALALNYAHSHGIVHRDVKPGNIIIDVSRRALLTDFGLAKGTNTTDSRNLTQSGAAIGTPAYMSPEQAKGSKIDARSDIYSLGAVLYEMLTGRPPFLGDAVGTVLLGVMSQDPVAPSKLNPGIHPHIETICMKAMAKDKESRYSTAKEMADDIDRFLYGETIKAKPLPLLGRFWKKLTKHLSFVVPLVLLCGILGILLGGFLFNAYLSYRQAQWNYENGTQSLNTGHYKTALKFFQEVARSQGFYRQISEELKERADGHISKGNRLLNMYDQNQHDVNQHYQMELKRLASAQTDGEKKKSLIELQNLENIRERNRRDIFLSFQNFWNAFLCEPFNLDATNGLTEVYFRKLQHVEANHDFKTVSFYLYQLNLLHENKLNVKYKTGSIQVRSKVGNTDVYLFAIKNLYLRRIPMGWNLAKGLSYEKYESMVDRFQKYLDVSDPLTDEQSYCGKAPLSMEGLPPGHYLVVTESPGHAQWRKVFQLHCGEKVEIVAPSVRALPILKNFQYLDLNHPHYASFLSRTEITCAQYQQFLEDSETLNKYHELESRGYLHYVPRLGNKKLWDYRDGKFHHHKDPDSPVAGVSFRDAIEYCNWLSKKTDNKIIYRLLSQEEWEFIAGAFDGRSYPWGDHFDEFFVSSKEFGESKLDVTPYGIKNMGGGVSEWCVLRTNDGKEIPVVCGGNFRLSRSESFRIVNHSTRPRDFTSDDLGFRVVALMSQ